MGRRIGERYRNCEEDSTPRGIEQENQVRNSEQFYALSLWERVTKAGGLFRVCPTKPSPRPSPKRKRSENGTTTRFGAVSGLRGCQSTNFSWAFIEQTECPTKVGTLTPEGEPESQLLVIPD